MYQVNRSITLIELNIGKVSRIRKSLDCFSIQNHGHTHCFEIDKVFKNTRIIFDEKKQIAELLSVNIECIVTTTASHVKYQLFNFSNLNAILEL